MNEEISPDIFALAAGIVFLSALGWLVFKFASNGSSVLFFALVLLFAYILWASTKQCL